MTAAERKIELERKLSEALAPQVLNVIDESHLHAGHPGAKSGASHFAIEIEAEALLGLNRVKQHQKIYAAVGQMIPTEIHALRIIIL